VRIRSVLIALLAVAGSFASVAAAPDQASADASFTFYGAGFGHGLGMSQWGAFGLAQRGWSHQDILTHYYTGTTVTAWTASAPDVRVGLTQGRQTIHVVAKGGPLPVMLAKSGATVGEISAGAEWTFASSKNAYRILDQNGNVLGGHLWGGEADDVVIPVSPSARAVVPELSHSYARGRLQLELYNCGGCRMRLLAVVPMQEYLYGIAEVSNGWPVQALEAQADAARTYALRKILSYGQHRAGCDCGLYATTADQVYAGWDKESSYEGDRWVAAVDATAGEVVEYHGDPIQAFYMASSGGYTESNENVWGGTPLPYLRGVCDPGDYVAENPSRTWTATFSATSLTSRLRPYTGDIGTVRGFGKGSRGVSGRITQITVDGSSGSHAISGSALKAALGLRDDRVWIDHDRLVTGSIRKRYDRTMCKPGLARSAVKAVPGGSRQRFEHGAIYDGGSGPTVWLHGPVYDYYRSIGGPGGTAGFPTSGVKGGGSGSTFATFHNGTITCSKGGGCALS
jgi:stage II sporulation protein D